MERGGFARRVVGPHTGNTFPSEFRFGGTNLDTAESIRFGGLSGPVDPTTGLLDLSEGTIVDLGVSGAPTGALGILLGTSNFDHVLDLELQALEEQGKSKTIASPRVTTLDNKEAVINAGEKVAFASASSEGTKIEFIDADIRLTVTPHITADENVYMKIVAMQNSFVFPPPGSPLPPTITTKEANTEVLVDNGATTVLGGVYQKETSEKRRNLSTPISG